MGFGVEQRQITGQVRAEGVKWSLDDPRRFQRGQDGSWAMVEMLKFFYKPWGMVVLGLLGIAGGGLMIAAATEALPERSELTRVSGVVDKAVKITSRGAISVRFDLDIKSASGEVVTLRMPEEQITEAQVQRVVGQPVVVLYGETDSVWELTTGSNTIISYAQTRQRKLQTQADEARQGPYIAGGGGLVILVGLVRGLLRRRQAAKAA
jgi:hypothetical protein